MDVTNCYCDNVTDDFNQNKYIALFNFSKDNLDEYKQV